MIDAARDEWLTEGVMPRRCLAWLVDALLALCLVLIAKIAFVAVGVATLGIGFALLGLLPAIPFLYVLGFLLGAPAATPGQRLAGIVVRRDGDIGPPDPARLLIWTVGLTITMIAGMVWMLAALFTVRHRTLHDIASGLVMVRTRAVAGRTGFWAAERASGRPFA